MLLQNECCAMPQGNVQGPAHAHCKGLAHVNGMYVCEGCTESPWHMKSGMTRWKLLPLNERGFPMRPTPFSPAKRPTESLVCGYGPPASCIYSYLQQSNDHSTVGTKSIARLDDDSYRYKVHGSFQLCEEPHPSAAVQSHGDQGLNKDLFVTR